MTVVAKVKYALGPMFHVAKDGRLMATANLKSPAWKFTGVRITRKPRHLYYVDKSGNVHERKAKGA